jgi:hypothetical protein
LRTNTKGTEEASGTVLYMAPEQWEKKEHDPEKSGMFVCLIFFFFVCFFHFCASIY